MPSTGRGTYEPPDDVRIFDGAEEDDDTEGSRLPLLIVIALFVLAAFGGVVWLAYTQGVSRGRNDAPKVIAAESGPAKVAANGSDTATPNKGLKIYQDQAPADDQSDKQVAPPPSSAAPETDIVTPHSPPPAAVKAQAEPAPAETKPAPAPIEAKKPAPPPPEIRTATTTPAPDQEATAPPAQLGLKTTPAAKTKPAAAPAAAPGHAAGAYLLQIGAYKSEAEADAAWKIYQSHHAGTLSGHSKDVKQVDLGAKGTWYRLRIGGFASKEASAQLCSKLTAEGGACFPAK
jgi:cell division protein FtsN